MDELIEQKYLDRIGFICVFDRKLRVSTRPYKIKNEENSKIEMVSTSVKRPFPFELFITLSGKAKRQRKDWAGWPIAEKSYS